MTLRDVGGPLSPKKSIQPTKSVDKVRASGTNRNEADDQEAEALRVQEAEGRRKARDSRPATLPQQQTVDDPALDEDGDGVMADMTAAGEMLPGQEGEFQDAPAESAADPAKVQAVADYFAGKLTQQQLFAQHPDLATGGDNLDSSAPSPAQDDGSGMFGDTAPPDTVALAGSPVVSRDAVSSPNKPSPQAAAPQPDESAASGLVGDSAADEPDPTAVAGSQDESEPQGFLGSPAQGPGETAEGVVQQQRRPAEEDTDGNPAYAPTEDQGIPPVVVVPAPAAVPEPTDQTPAGGEGTAAPPPAAPAPVTAPVQTPALPEASPAGGEAGLADTGPDRAVPPAPAAAPYGDADSPDALQDSVVATGEERPEIPPAVEDTSGNALHAQGDDQGIAPVVTEPAPAVEDTSGDAAQAMGDTADADIPRPDRPTATEDDSGNALHAEGDQGIAPPAPVVPAPAAAPEPTDQSPAGGEGTAPAQTPTAPAAVPVATAAPPEGSPAGGESGLDDSGPERAAQPPESAAPPDPADTLDALQNSSVEAAAKRGEIFEAPETPTAPAGAPADSAEGLTGDAAAQEGRDLPVVDGAASANTQAIVDRIERRGGETVGDPNVDDALEPDQRSASESDSQAYDGPAAGDQRLRQTVTPF